MPFLADHLWRNLVRGGRVRRSTSPAGPRWPSPTRSCSPRSPRCAASSSSGARRARPSGLKLRQPLRRLVVAGAPLAGAHADEIADELRVKEVEFGDVEASELRVKPNLPVLGPKLGAGAAARCAPRSPRDASRSSTAGASGSTATCSSPTRCSSSGSAARAGRSRPTAASPSRSTRRSTTSCGSRRALNDLIRAVQVLRKDSGLEITDRIRLWIPDPELLPFSERIAGETLAVSVELGPELRLERA